MELVLVLAALLFGLNYILTYTAEVKLDSGLVAVLFGTLPFFAFAFAHAMLGEKITPRIWFGSILAFGGVVVISLVGQVRANCSSRWRRSARPPVRRSPTSTPSATQAIVRYHVAAGDGDRRRGRVRDRPDRRSAPVERRALRFCRCCAALSPRSSAAASRSS